MGETINTSKSNSIEKETLIKAFRLMSTAKFLAEKYEENKKKREAGSASGFAGNDELGKIGLYETTATEYRKLQKQKENAEKTGIDQSFGDTPVYMTPSGQSPEEKKAYEKSRQEYQKIFSEAIPVVEKQTKAVAEKAKNDPTAYKKDKYGITVPDPLWVAKEARNIASKAGAPINGYAENLIQSRIEAALVGNEKAPEVLKEADRIAIKKYGKPVTGLYSEDVYKNVEPIQVHQDRLKASAKKAKQTIDAEYNPKFDAVNNEYSSFVAKYKASLAGDPSIKQAVDEYDAKSIEALQMGVQDGTLSADEANAMLRSKSSLDARSAYINGVIDKKYGAELKSKYDKYLTGISVLNNRRNSRLRRQYDELEDYTNAQYKNQIEIAKKNFKISPERAKLLEEIQNEAYNNVMGKEMEGKRRYDINADLWENFMSSSLKGLGEGIQSTAFTLGMEDVSAFGNLLAKNFETSDLNINSWSDVGFGQEGRTKFAMSAGNILGRMSPGLAASAAVATATGGAGLGALPSMLLAGVPSAAFETADIMGSVEQQMLSQSQGDIAKAQQAGSRALESQLKIWPTYLLDGLPFFPKLLKFAGKSRYSGLNILSRGFAGGGINLITETAQEVPQNVFEEIILADKDPTFAELFKNITAEKIANTSASVVSMSLLMGSAPQVMDASQDAVAKRAAAGYYAKQILNEASHPGLMVENQSQFIIQLADQKDTRFAAQMINILLQKGNIDKPRAEVLARKLENYERFKETPAGKSTNKIFRQAGFILYDRYLEARNSKNKEAEEASLKALQDYSNTGNAELVMLGTPDGSFNVYTYEDLNTLMADADFQQASRERSDKYGALFTVTPLIQTQEALQNPKLQELLQRFEDIQKPAAESEKTEETSKQQQIDDEKILEGQKRTGMQVPKLFDIIPVEAAAVVDAVRSGEQGITPEEINGASGVIYQIHKMYQKMRVSTTRNLTLAQIDDITSDLEQAVIDLENQKTRLAVGDEQMGLLQQQDTESAQTIEAATQAAETEQEEVPVETTGTAPEETPTPAKPKAKINLFTNDEVENAFTQEEQELYEKLLFNGEENLANRMLETKRSELIGREVEQVGRGEISEKVKAFYAKFGIGIEVLSADDFVRVLEENGESASRGQEGVFDDKNGKIYINRDSFDTGFGTTVVWHEAVHPIMNIIHNSNKPLYDKIHRGILANAKANPKGTMASIIRDVERLYTNSKGYNEASRKDEIIVETIARLSAGTMSFSELQPTLRQQFIDLINRIGRIMGLSKGETNDMKALKDLAKKITAEINKAGEGNLSEIVGLENVGKTQRPKIMTSNMAESLGGRGQMSLQQNGTGIALEGNEKIIKGKNAPTVSTDKGYEEDYSLDDIMNTDLAPGSRTVSLALTIAKGEASYKDKNSDNRIKVLLPYKNDAVRKKIEKLRDKYSSIKGSSKPAAEEKAKIKNQINIEAKKILQEFTGLMAQNILALYDTLSPAFMEISKQWYIGANRMANALASKYGKSIEQVSGIIAALSPQKDWFNNVSAAERVIDIMANHADTKLTQEIVDKAVDYNTDRSTKKPKLNEFANDLIDFFKEYGEVSINDLNSRGISLQNQAVILRAIDHAVNSPKVAITDPNGKFIGYDSTPIRWNGFGEIGKAMFMYRSSSIEDINSQLGNGNKVRNFYNNIVDPNSTTPYVTADTHAISAALAAPMSAEDASGVGLFLGQKEPLYALVKEAYIKAADIAGILPREMQSITWEAQRVGINNKARTEDNKNSNFAYIAETRENSQTPYERATELIARNISTNPEWGKDRGIVTQRSVDEIRNGAKLRAEQRIGEISNLREYSRGRQGAVPSELGGRTTGGPGAEKGPITQKSLGGREKASNFEPENEKEQQLRSERAGDGGGRNIGGAETPLAGAPNVPGATGPDPRLVDVARRYAIKAGIPYRRQGEYVKVDPERGERIARAYADMKHDPQNPKVKEAYADLIRQTKDQYQALVDDGYKFSFFDADTDPYDGNPSSAMRDLRANKSMAVFGTYAGYGTEGITGAAVEDNPMLESTGLKWPDQSGVMQDVTANDLFRAVHDAFGHGLEGSSFRARGEENAWQAHIRLFTGPAVAAITSETRGQNSWLNFGPYGETNRSAKIDGTIFAEQKTGLMPEWTWTEGRSPDMEEGGGSQASLGGRGNAEVDGIVSKAKADGTYLKAPNGKRTNLNESQWAQVRTKNFKNWFGDWENDPEGASKVVDGNGEPQVVYHGSSYGGIEIFNRKESKRLSSGLKEFGDYFATNKSLADFYQKHGGLNKEFLQKIDIDIEKLQDKLFGVKNNKEYDAINEELNRLKGLKAGKTYSVFLNLRKVKEFDAKGKEEMSAWRELEVDAGYKMASNRDAMEFLKEGRFGVEKVDGVIARNIVDAFVQGDEKLTKELIGDVVLVFDGNPNRIKSATENVGAFSTEDDRIQASLGGRQNAPSFADLDEVLDMSPVKSRAAREKLIDQYGKETVDKMIEISRNFEKIINDLEEREVVKKDCP